MNKRMALMAIAASVAAMAAAAPADAKIRLRTWHGVPWFEYYEPYPGERFSAEEYDNSYAYDENGNLVFDESYYDPYYLPPSKGPMKTLRPQQKQTATRGKAVTGTTAKTASAKPKAADDIETASISPDAPTKTGGGTISCDKATSIVSGYGFGTVKPTSCAGKTYEFSALRDGKKFLIKVSSASGELTEVKKLD